MALQAAYKQFLAAPNSSALAADASLHYITTTTSYHGPTDIIKHLGSQRNRIKKKKEDVLSVIEGQNAVAVETETSLEFVSSGGAYLPGMDDNFLADRTVYIPITHMVSFDSDGKIAQIRQSWDQGALLKQLDIIGKSGRNWPIRDSAEQIKLIVKSAGKPVEETPSDIINRSRDNSTNAMRDPHTTLNLFAPRDEEIEPSGVVSPYAGTRPPQRTFEDILGDEDDDAAAGERPQSPTKAVAPKAGAGKNFQPPRLFEASEDNTVSDPNTPDKSPNRFYRPHPKRFDHFDFADGSDPADKPQPGTDFDKRPKTRHDSHWSFDDFVTPQKANPSRAMRSQDVRHWSTEEDGAQETPVKKPVVPKPRRDAETHFELQDDGLPSNEPRPAGRPRGTMHNTGLGLYKNHLVTDDGSEPAEDPDPRALGNITNLKDRSKTFAPHFSMADDSPRQGSPPKHASHISEDRQKAVKMMEANWSAYDDSPSQKENSNPSRNVASKENRENGPNHRIVIAGDGMGNRKGGRGWSIGDESDEEQAQAPPPPGKKQGPQTKASSFWDF